MLLLSTPEQMIGATYAIYLVSGELVVEGTIHSSKQIVSIPEASSTLSYIVRMGTYSSVITSL